MTTAVDPHNPKIQLDSFTFETPDDGLALLANGAGGLLTLRRYRTAQ